MNEIFKNKFLYAILKEKIRLPSNMYLFNECSYDIQNIKSIGMKALLKKMKASKQNKLLKIIQKLIEKARLLEGLEPIKRDRLDKINDNDSELNKLEEEIKIYYNVYFKEISKNNEDPFYHLK